MADALSLEERVAKIEGRVEEMALWYAEKGEMATILGRVDSLSMRVDSLGQRVDSLSGRIETLTGRVEALNGRVDRVETRLDRLDQKVDRIPWFILASWVTIMLALVGGLYLR